MRGVGSAAAVKVVVMGITGLVGLITSRLIIESFGIDAYAQYGLLASMPSLLPFADLGLAAVVINAIAESPDVRRDLATRRTLVSALRLLTVSSGVIILIAVLVTAFGWWPVILGDGLMPDGNLVAGICMMLFGIALPLTIGSRIMVGLGRNTLQIAVQVITAPLILVLVGGCILLGVDAGGYLAIAAYIASLAVAAVGFAVAGRLIAPQLGAVLRDLIHVRHSPGVRVVNMAWPMLVQMLALPLAMQTSRILISHLGDVHELARYNLANQIFSIALQTISAAGIALWPVFARARAARRVETPWVATTWFLIGGIVIAGGMAVISPWLVEIVSGDQLSLPVGLVIAFVVFVALQAVKYPIGMYMTDLAGLRFQVLPTTLMVPIAIGGSWLAIPVIGAAGSVLAVSAAVLLCQVVPNFLFVLWDLGRRRASLGGGTGVAG